MLFMCCIVKTEHWIIDYLSYIINYNELFKKNVYCKLYTEPHRPSFSSQILLFMIAFIFLVVRLYLKSWAGSPLSFIASISGSLHTFGDHPFLLCLDTQLDLGWSLVSCYTLFLTSSHILRVHKFDGVYTWSYYFFSLY